MKQDKTIQCADCEQEFAFTGGEQEFYESKGLEEPTHCLICRGKYEAQQRDVGQYKIRDKRPADAKAKAGK